MKYITAFLLPLVLSGCVLTEQNTAQQQIAEAITSEHDELTCVVFKELVQELREASNEGVLAVIHPAESLSLIHF